mgnify:CR=1 FL=1
MTIADKILEFYSKLEPPTGLPADVVVMNPYRNTEAWRVTEEFYRRFYNDEKERVVLFGINPGRFGGGITGIPFTDPIHLESVCKIINPFNKRAELSSRFIYEMIEAFGGPENFYRKFFISAISPLGFIQNEKNLNYYDIENWKELFEEYVVKKIKEQLAFPLNRKVAYSIGQGQNLKYLSALNKKYQFFERIETVPHPRWVMQYRLKRKEEFINQYVQTLDPS